MKERPILFSSEMMRAILDGRKTQTRRVITPQPIIANDGKLDWVVDGRWKGAWTPGEGGNMTCPYGKHGDRLWVRETWAPGMVFKGDVQEYLYRATHTQSPPTVWRPSIVMPRAASRITLEITGVRVERLQDISIADCVAEGCAGDDPEQASPDKSRPWRNAHAEYAALWDSINAKRGYGWDANPWVWVVAFAVLNP